MLMSQDGSTAYPFSGEQIKTLARVKLEFTFILEENKSMYEMLRWCDSIEAVQQAIIGEKDVQLGLKNQQIDALDNIVSFNIQKFDLSEKQGKRFKRQRNLSIGTAAAVILLLIIVGT